MFYSSAIFGHAKIHIISMNAICYVCEFDLMKCFWNKLTDCYLDFLIFVNSTFQYDSCLGSS